MKRVKKIDDDRVLKIHNEEVCEEECPHCDGLVEEEDNADTAGMYMRCPFCGKWSLLCSSVCVDHTGCGNCPYEKTDYLLIIYFTTKYDDAENIINKFGCVDMSKEDGNYDVKFNEMLDILTRFKMDVYSGVCKVTKKFIEMVSNELKAKNAE